MKLTDIVELAKQGYKPSDIRELIEISEATEAHEAEQKTPEEDQVNVDADATSSSATDEEQNADDKSVDYKALYEAEKDKTSKLQKALTSADMSGDDQTSDFDTVLDAVKSFM